MFSVVSALTADKSMLTGIVPELAAVSKLTVPVGTGAGGGVPSAGVAGAFGSLAGGVPSVVVVVGVVPVSLGIATATAVPSDVFTI